MLQVIKLFTLWLECVTLANPFAAGWSIDVQAKLVPLGEVTSVTMQLKLLSPPGLAECLKSGLSEASS